MGIVEAARPEERALDEADQVLDGPLLLWTAGRAELDREAKVDRHLGKRRVPDRSAVLVLANHHRGRPVEHHPERDASRLLEREKKGSDQRLRPLVGHDHDPDPPRELEPVGRKVDPLLPTLRQPHVHLAEVELRELPGDPLEADHQGLRDRLSYPLPHPIEGALAERDAFLPKEPQDLEPRSHGILLDQRPHPLARSGLDPGPAQPSSASGQPALGLHNRWLVPDSAYRPRRNAEVPGHLSVRHPRRQHLLHCVSIDHPEHRPLTPAPRSGSDSNSEGKILHELGPGGTDFREESGQSLENPHPCSNRWPFAHGNGASHPTG